MESFYSLLQKNVLDRKRWATRDELATAIVIWIEHTYNNRRRQRGLGKLTLPSSSWRSPTGTIRLPEDRAGGSQTFSRPVQPQPLDRKA